MTKIKVFQGTRSVDAPRLCDSCSNGVVMRGPADSEEYVYCSLMDKPIHQPAINLGVFRAAGQACHGKKPNPRRAS